MKHITSPKRYVAVLLTVLLVGLAVPAAEALDIDSVLPNGLKVSWKSASDLPWASDINLIDILVAGVVLAMPKPDFRPPAGWSATPRFDSIIARAAAPDGGDRPNAAAATYAYTLDPADLGLATGDDALTLTDGAQRLTDRGFGVLFTNEKGATITVIGGGGTLSWQEALRTGIARVDRDGDVFLDINLAVFDADGTASGRWKESNYAFVNDGMENGIVFDPVWLVTDLAQEATGGTDAKGNPHSGR